MTIQVSAVFDKKTDTQIQNVIKDSMKDAVKQSLDVLREAAIAAAHFRSRTGRLRRAIETNVIDETSGEVFINENIAPYGPFIHEGTGVHGPSARPYAIYSQTGKTLHWTENGRQFFASRVFETGIAEDPFLYEASKMVAEDIEAIYDRALDKAIEELGL